MYSPQLRKLSTYLLGLVLIHAIGFTGDECFAKASNAPLGTTSLKPFIRKIGKNYGSTYAQKVKELFGVFQNAKGPSIPGEETSFLEFNALKMKVVDNKAQAVKINMSDVVRVKENVKISFTPRRGCSLYLFRVKATGIIFPLFPRRKFSALTNPLTANLTYFVPPMKKWLSLGRDYGKGAIIVFASTHRNHSIEKLMEYFTSPSTLETLSEKKDASTLNEIPIINRGIGNLKD
ncbi:MAG: DUF4384 domain-containing protein, partial [Planctomycetes bacterium]|nr:DUF4384 domain-containing protein [Planctomycetota bacterium]